jgi:hypothetical protein
MHRIMRLLLDAPETAPSGSGRSGRRVTTVSAMPTVVAPGAALWILSAAPDGGAAAATNGAVGLPPALSGWDRSRL